MDAKVEQQPAAEPKAQWDKLNVEIEYSGRAITLPEDPDKMPLREAIKALQHRERDDNQEFAVHEWIDAYPLDAAVCFTRAMAQLYGWASPQTVMTFFGPKPPSMLTVKTGLKDDDVVQCPMGQFILPGVEAPVNTSIARNSQANNEMQFVIHGTIKKRDRHVILELATRTKKLLREASIYRGKVIRLAVDENGVLNTNNPPSFFDVSDTTEAAVLFDDEVAAQIDTNILVPIKHTKRCRKLRIPLKRTEILEGPFGTGKSLLARVVANVAERHNWTFVLLDRVQGLQAALEFAKRYSPAVVFAEDIDRIAEDRDDDTNDLVNVIDGVVSKGVEIITILTTNHVEKIAPVMLRPGRVDAILSLRAPSAPTVEKLIRHYAGEWLPDDEPIGAAGNEMAGQIPATIRECVERAKLGMIGRSAEHINDADLVLSARTMKNHLALMAPRTEISSAAERLATSLAEVIRDPEIKEKIEEIHQHTT